LAIEGDLAGNSIKTAPQRRDAEMRNPPDGGRMRRFNGIAGREAPQRADGSAQRFAEGLRGPIGPSIAFCLGRGDAPCPHWQAEGVAFPMEKALAGAVIVDDLANGTIAAGARVGKIDELINSAGACALRKGERIDIDLARSARSDQRPLRLRRANTGGAKTQCQASAG